MDGAQVSAVARGESVLVTGGTGFLGAWLTKALADAGADVVCLVRDDNPGSNFERLGLPQRVRQVRGSLTDLATVERALNEYEVRTVVHLAAQTQVGVANRSPLSTFRANVEGTWNLLEACRALPHVERIVVASSDKAYGSHDTLPYEEDAPLLAKHPYDASKAMTEILCRTYAHTYGAPVAVTRCGNIYGPGDTNFQRIVPDTARALHEGRNPVILSDGTPVRD
ncbi:MAG TPA: NAD-dependent epimerase/dehydratase family protein, partial [Candidatus Thermoplasmatota archaeon]|nr:NAD-dependent epimerase/dehydratase family protein [Candidatus Thermoplasmatota archaeon]